MKKIIRFSLVALCFGYISMIGACSDDIGPASQCNNCNSDFPYSTDGSSTCYETQASCESAEGTDCFICL